QMTETVVDDLEAVEVEIERRESAAAGPCFELFETEPEPLHEDRTVAQACQRIEESRGAELLLCDRSLRRVGQRSGDAGRAATCGPPRNTAAQEPPAGAGLVAEQQRVVPGSRPAGGW